MSPCPFPMTITITPQAPQSLLIVAEHNAIRINYIKVKMKNRQNSKYKLCSDIDEMVNRVKKRMQQIGTKKYKTR